MEAAYTDEQLRRLSPLVLAYIGDAVYELKVRERIIGNSGKMDQLHTLAVSYVKAERQSRLYQQIAPLLSEQEADIYRHARNAKSGHQPPHTAVGAYRRATGVEALIGWLYLRGEYQRLELIFEHLFAAEDETQE
ncbi:MAG: ribonuclease III domain-containing protein [Bacillota bacterium]|nr:ribonuclease III domain-containing protein [Bacillota bacterium]